MIIMFVSMGVILFYVIMKVIAKSLTARVLDEFIMTFLAMIILFGGIAGFVVFPILYYACNIAESKFLVIGAILCLLGLLLWRTWQRFTDSDNKRIWHDLDYHCPGTRRREMFNSKGKQYEQE